MAVVATGFFDGVHLGHRLVIDTLLSEAKRRGERSVIITFWPHPRTVLQDDARSLRLLTSQEEKISLLKSMGVDDVVVLPFTRGFASLKASDYIRDILPEYGCDCLVLGYDTRLGSDLLGPQEIAAIYPESIIVPVCTLPSSGDVVSSTKIRQSIIGGDMESAADMLGRPYSLKGVVVAGNQLGRTIGFPTANMQLYEPLKLVPARGVYKVEVETLGNVYGGMTNIGVRPTVSEHAVPTIETNIFDFDEMIYGLDIQVRFIKKIRDERRFSNIGELAAQLEADRNLCLHGED